jgi:HSP20 family protein
MKGGDDMRTITRWNPFREMISLRNTMDQMLEESFNRLLGETTDPAAASLSVPVDMYEKNGDFVIRTDLPGLKAEDIDISIKDDALTIKGEFEREKDEERENVHFQEIRYGKFQRMVKLPGNVDPDRVEAIFEDGVLRLTMPKTEESKLKQISVKARS